MLCNRVEMLVFEPFVNQLRVSLPERATLVFAGTPERPGHKRQLLLGLRLHVERTEETIDPVIGEHFLVEKFYGSHNRCFAANAFVQTGA